MSDNISAQLNKRPSDEVLVVTTETAKDISTVIPDQVIFDLVMAVNNFDNCHHPLSMSRYSDQQAAAARLNAKAKSLLRYCRQY